MTAGQESSATRSRRNLFVWIWYLSSLAYCAVRVFLADRYLRDYGLNVTTFALIEFGSAVPYALGSARAIGALADREPRRAAPWALLASAGFLAPDVHTLLTAEKAPTWLIGLIGMWLAGAAAFTLYRTGAAVRARRT